MFFNELLPKANSGANCRIIYSFDMLNFYVTYVILLPSAIS